MPDAPLDRAPAAAPQGVVEAADLVGGHEGPAYGGDDTKHLMVRHGPTDSPGTGTGSGARHLVVGQDGQVGKP